MSQELGYQSYLDQPRVSARLIVAGIGLLLIGLCCTCTLVTVPVSMAYGPPTASHATRISLLWSMGMILPLTVITIWTGIACFLGKRWVRPIILIGSAFTLAIIVPTVIGMAVAVRKSPFPTTGPGVPNLLVNIVAFGAIGVIYIGVPLLYLLLFLPASVKELLVRLDPKPRWTDRLPVPLLGMIAATVIFGIQLPVGALLMPRPAMMGVQMSSIVAAVPMTLLTVGMLIAAGRLWQRRVDGWWLAVGLVLLLALSNFVNVLVLGPHLFDEAFDETQIKQISDSPFASPRFMLAGQVAWVLVMMAGAIWVKKCCLNAPSAQPNNRAMTPDQAASLPVITPKPNGD